MKVIHLIDAIQDFMASDAAGDSKGMYHPEIIRQHLNNAFNQAVYATWLNGKKYSDFSHLDAWSKTYECTVFNQVGTKAHAFLPFAPMQLPENEGLREVCDHDDSSNVFAPVEATAGVVFAELEVHTMDSTPIYHLEQNNLNTGAGESSHILILEKLPVAPDAITSIDVLMVTPLSEYDLYDEVAMPSESADQLIQQVIMLLSKKPAPDTANDMVIERKA